MFSSPLTPHNSVYFCDAGNPGYPRREATTTTTPSTTHFQPISVPAITVDELRSVTDNFGTKSFIGEGAYGKVYYAVLGNGRAVAIKKLDSTKQPEQEFLAQVWFKCSLLLLFHLISYWLNSYSALL